MAVQILTDLGGIQNFDCHSDPTNIGPRWKKWRRAFEFFVIGKGVTDANQKKALLLHCGGMSMQDIFCTLTVPEPDTDNGEDAYSVAMKVLDQYFSPKDNALYERHVFRAMQQMTSETIDQFVTRLRQKADFCDFPNEEESIRDQVIEKCVSNHLRRKLLEKGKDLTLTKLQEIARAFESSEIQASRMEGGTIQNEVNHVKTKRRSNSDRDRDHGKTDRRCYRCDKSDHVRHLQVNCPFKGKECYNCHKVGHLAKCCKTKTAVEKQKSRKPGGRNSKQKVRLVGEEGDPEGNSEAYAFSIDIDSSSVKVSVTLGTVPNIPMIIDSGASCNVIDRHLWENLKQKNIVCQSSKSESKLYPYGNREPIKVIGKFNTVLAVNGMQTKADVLVIDGVGQALLGRKTSLELGVLKLGPSVDSVSDVQESGQRGLDQICKKYSKCFHGIGKLENFELEIPIDKTVPPVAQTLRRIPFNLRSKVEQKLKELEDLDIIEKAEGPTPWVSPVVVVPKSGGDIRLCVDMRRANEAIIRERHPIPTVDDVLYDLNQSTVFSKLDIKWAFHQIQLSEDSRPITTFVTHLGLFRYKRLMFGISCAPEMYQRVIQQALQGLEGVRNIFDDIIIHGKSTEEHDKRLEKLLDRIQELGLTLNKGECNFRMTELVFMGHLLSSRGIGPEEEKVRAVKETRQPENAAEVRSFLGLVNYSSRFIPDLATVAEPLRQLTRKGTSFQWTTKQEKAFQELKLRLQNTKTLGYFDGNAKTTLITDASPVGLGAVLIQEIKGENRVICYISRSLTDTERRYSQTEKEALGIVWACERLHMYLYGTDFTLLTDHKPLECIYSTKSKGTSSARIHRWVLRLQPYKFRVVHIPGKHNIADSLSRLLTFEGKPNSDMGKDEDEYIRFVAVTATPNALTTREMERESTKDEEIANIREAIRTNRWNRVTCKTVLPIKDELACIGMLVLRGSRILVPKSLREAVLKLAHEGHPGIVVMKRNLRTKVWWPGIDREAEKFCRSCHSCQLVSSPEKPEPMKPTDIPSSPWEHISADLMCLPTGDNLFVVVDYYSRYFEVDVMKSTTTDRLVRSLRKMFLTHGLPVSITTDNGPQFRSSDFKDYLESEGIMHRRTTPLWPQANGEVERQNRTLLKRIRIAFAEKRNWREEIDKFLWMYRTTPHSVTGVSPSELMFKRKIRTKIPAIYDTSVEDVEITDRDRENKGKGKLYSDARRQAKESDIKIGDKVLVKRDKQDKLTPNFYDEPYKVVERSGNAVTVADEKNNVKYKRNITHVKQYNDPREDCAKEIPEDFVTSQSDDTDLEDSIDVPAPSTSRPKRETRLPARFKDFMMSD